MAIRNYKKISELEAITSASLSTYVAGVDNGQTVRITLDVLADGVRNTINTIDVQRLNAIEAQTGSYLTSLNGSISSSSQLTSSYDVRYVVSGSITQTTWDNIASKPDGIVSQSTDLSTLNSFTQSQDILNTAFINGISGRLTTSSFNSYTASQSTSSLVDRLNTIESVSGSWITESETGSFLTSLNGAISSSSQLTSSYDVRYTLSGSVGETPLGTISGSAQISAFGFISSSHTDITSLNSFTASQSILNTAFNNGISARLQTSSFNDYTTSVDTRLNTLETSITKASGIVNKGVDVTLGNLKARLAATGNESLQLSTVSGTYNIYGSGTYNQNGTIAGITLTSTLSITTTPTYIAAGYDFAIAGAVDVWNIVDVGSGIAWRITMIIGFGFLNNFISIERLN